MGMSDIELPDDWTTIPFERYICRLRSNGGTLKKKEYKENGTFPIVDQGQLLVAGFTDKTDYLFQGPYPVIVFGDHSKNVKYIDFKFAVGADGVVLLRSKDENKLYSKYFYHWLKNAPIHNLGYSRHYKLLKELEIPIPPTIEEQHRIVSRIEELTSRVEKAKQVLKEVEEEINNFTPSLLTKAFRGCVQPW